MPLPQPFPDLVSLDLLQSVALLGSIRQAALAHAISQPAASTRLRLLEQVVGLELLDRSSGRAQLTPAGGAVVQWSERILDDMRALLVGTSALKTERRTRLRLVASMTVAEYLIPQWLTRLRSIDPDLRVSLEMGNSVQVVGWVESGKADLGFVEGHSSLAGLQQRVVANDELVLVVAPSHPWARRRKPVSATELAGTPLVLREVGSGTREVFEDSMTRQGLSIVPMVELGSTTAIKGAVIGGLGPTVLSRLATYGDVQDHRLVIVPTTGVDLTRSICAVWPSTQPLSSAAKRLLAQIDVVANENKKAR
ncbi:MAG: LysR family transcriptional regulator [Acidimicrobiales bacterium]